MLIGADVAELLALANRMRAAERQIRDSSLRITAVLRNVPWVGNDAARMRARWEQSDRRALNRVADGLAKASQDLRNHAGQQDRASAAGSSIRVTPVSISGLFPDQATVDQAVEEIRRLLKADFGGVNARDMDDIGRAFEGLTGAEADAVIAALSDEDLARFYDQMDDLAIFGGWSGEEIRAFHVMMGEKVSLDTWRRMGTFTEWIDPDPSTAIPDSARDNPATVKRFQELEYYPFGDLLAAAGDDPHPFGFDDMRQGSIGDCYLIAAMMNLADNHPELLAETIQENPNGTYTVTFANGHQQVVSPEFPARLATGQPFFARGALNPDGDQIELWPMILEKAYAQEKGSWGAISGGSPSKAIEYITGLESGTIRPRGIEISDLAARMDRGEMLALGTINKPKGMTISDWRDLPSTPQPFKDGRLFQKHAFVIVGVDESAGTVLVRNPWNPARPPVALTIEELEASTNLIYTNEAP